MKRNWAPQKETKRKLHIFGHPSGPAPTSIQSYNFLPEQEKDIEQKEKGFSQQVKPSILSLEPVKQLICLS